MEVLNVWWNTERKENYGKLNIENLNKHELILNMYNIKNREHPIDESFNKEKALRCLRQAFKCKNESRRYLFSPENNTPVSRLKKHR